MARNERAWTLEEEGLLREKYPEIEYKVITL